MKTIRDFARDESGAAIVEYSLLIGCITAAILTAILFVSGYIDNSWSSLEGELTP